MNNTVVFEPSAVSTNTSNNILEAVVTNAETAVVVSNTDSFSVIQTIKDTVILAVELVSTPVLGGIQGIQGIQGISGTTEEDTMYSKRIDFISDSLLYRGEALVGSAENAAVWRIRKITIDIDGDITEVWASGTASFDKVWIDRASLPYS